MADRTQLMRRAVSHALKHMRAGHGGPFGALIVKDGEVIARGHNRVTSSCDPTAHAEVEAIRSACKTLGVFSLEGYELFTTCEPCPMCLAAAWWARLDRIWYASTRDDAAAAGFDDAELYREVAAPLDARSLPIAQLQLPEAAELMSAWMEKSDKIAY